MNPDWTGELLAPFLGNSHLSEPQQHSMSLHLEMLLKWNLKLNLTAIRDPKEIVTRHFGESFFLASQLFPSGEANLSAIDVGSGAGFPGLPLKLWVPSLVVTLIESNHRKATFLSEVIRALKLDQASVLAGRAESGSLQADLVTFRAVEHFDRILPVAFGLTRPGGRIAILIGRSQLEEAISLLQGASWDEPISVPNSRSRVVLVAAKADQKGQTDDDLIPV
jgi:16S rRNA (guanine527-N7)-methyltransferase